MRKRHLRLGGNVTRSVSFFELRSCEGVQFESLGSGPCEAVLAREALGSRLRIYWQDPEEVRFRVRYGKCELTEEGLSYKAWDEFQHRGASPEVFSLALPITRWLGTNATATRQMLGRSREGWLELAGGEIFPCQEARARYALAEFADGNTSRAFIEIKVDAGHLDEFLALVQTAYGGQPGDEV